MEMRKVTETRRGKTGGGLRDVTQELLLRASGLIFKSWKRNIAHLRYQRLLSAYLDDELSSTLKEKVGQHLHECQFCCREHERLSFASHCIRELCLPEEVPVEEVPGFALGNVSHLLSGQRLSVTQMASWLRPKWVVAVVLLFALGLGLTGIFIHRPPSMREMLFDISPYLDAENRFEKRYAARSVALSEIATMVSFQPVAPEHLSGGYQLSSSYVLKSGCCRLLMLEYERDAERLTVFQLPAHHPVSCTGRAAEPLVVGQYAGARWQLGGQSAYRLDLDRCQLVLVGQLKKQQALALAKSFDDRAPDRRVMDQ